MKKMATLLKNNKIEDIISPVVIVIALILTQLILPINIGSRSIYLYYVEILIIGLSFFSFIDILKNKKKFNISKFLFVQLSLFVLWFLILTIYRYKVFGDITGNFIVFRVLFLPIIMFILLKQYKIKKKSIFAALLIFAILIILYQIINIIFVSHSFRAAQSLKNINIFLSFLIASLPILLIYSSKLKEYYKSNFLIILIRNCLNVLIIFLSILVFFSGSRLAILIFPLVFSISFFSIFKFKKLAILQFLLLLLVSVMSLLAVLKFDLYDANYNFGRSFEPIINMLKININNNTPSNSTTPNKNNKNHLKKPVKKPANDNNDSIIKNTTSIDSDNMRLLLWKKSIYYVKKNPIFGKVNLDIDIKMIFGNSHTVSTQIQAPHNFILEMWLAFGLPGLVIYLCLLIYFSLKILIQKIPMYLKINFLLVMFTIFSYSFLQPLVTCYFVISIVLWMTFYLFLKEE